MEETDKYQQRLLAIVERRRQQEEEEKLKRETEEEWLKTVQKKRKYLREQWLSQTTPPPVLLTLDTIRTGPPLQDEADGLTAAEQTKSQNTPEDKEEEAADARKEEQASQEQNKEPVNCTARAREPSTAATDEDVQVNKEAEDHFFIQMAQRMFHESGQDGLSVNKEAEDHLPVQRMFHESGQDGRSVLGMLAVQVERDPKTGATVVRSMAPVSTPAGAPKATTVFDDGRKSIHTVGGSGDQPSAEELGQILSAIDGVGMTALLDEVAVTPNKAEMKIENEGADTTPKEEILSFPTHHAMSTESKTQLDSPRSYDLKAELDLEDNPVSVLRKEDKTEDKSIAALKDVAGKVDNVEDQMLEEGPVTLVFLGYSDATTDQGDSQEEYEGMLTAERVIITEDGEEHVLGPETSVSPPSTLDTPAVQEAGKESQNEGFQDIPLDGNGAGVKVQGEDGDKGQQNSSSPIATEGEGTPKRKTCQCCSVM